jgi:hypothetical protein
VDFKGVEENAAEESDEVEGEGEALGRSEYEAERYAHEPGIEMHVNLAYFFHKSFGTGIVFIEYSIFDCSYFYLLFCDLCFFILLSGAICGYLLLRYIFLMSEVDAFFDELDGKEGSN